MDIPAGSDHIAAAMSKIRRIVHHLFGDATDIDAGATDAPLRSRGCWLDKVSESNDLRRHPERSKINAVIDEQNLLQAGDKVLA